MPTGYVGGICDRNEYPWNHWCTRSHYESTYHIPETGITGPSSKSFKLKMKKRVKCIKKWGTIRCLEIHAFATRLYKLKHAKRNISRKEIYIVPKYQT